MLRIIFLILGILCSSVGLMFFILYLNLLTLGYSFSNLVHFIISRGECLLFFFGIFIIIISWKGAVICELLLRSRTKF